MYWHLLRLELASQRRDILGIALPIFFILVLTLLFPLAVSPDPQLLSQFAVGISWLGVLLSLLVNLDRFCRAEYQQRVLEQYISTGVVAVWCMQIRILAVWLTTGLPLACAGLVVAFLCNLPITSYGWLFASLFFGTLALQAIGAVIAMLTVSSQHAGLVLAVVFVPLCVPIVIFGIDMVQLQVAGFSPWPQLSMLVGLSLFYMALSPILITVCLHRMLD